MSPQSPRIPTQGPAPAAASSGRHRRPESLADVGARGGPRVAVSTLTDTPISPRSARHSRPVRAGRHVATRPAAGRPPTTGSHRAPGTLPLESWLLMGRTRQGALLASLVAVGALLLAMPAEQRRDGFDAVNAAAQAVAGVQTEQKAPRPVAPPEAPASKDEKDGAPDTPEADAAPTEKVKPKPS